MPEPPEEYDGKPVLLATVFGVEVQIKDNPFVKVSPTTKYFKLIDKSETKVHVKILNKCTSVPYCDTFSVEEEWLAMSPSPTANCCIVRFGVQVIFYKNTLFKSKIQSETLKSCKKVMVDWTEFMKKRNVGFKEKKIPAAGGAGANKLKHGIEKSNKLFEKKDDSVS